jgi:REP element-mobilizing transposase RayT
MARKPRIEYEGALYHVLTRGNQKQKIFKNQEDFIKYLKILSDYKKQYDFYLYAFILMNNHIHLLIETKKAPLSKIMQGINQRYTVFFNKKYSTVGHLFQGRYKTILCERDAYLLSLIKYIHINPVRAKILTVPERYKWSSHHSYIGKNSNKDIVDTDLVLRMFSNDKTKARKLYRSFINDSLSVKKDDLYKTIDQRILGSEQFVTMVMKTQDVKIERIKKKKEFSLFEIKSKDRQISRGKKMFCIVAHEYGYSGREIALFTNKDPGLVSRYIKEKNKMKRELMKF